MEDPKSGTIERRHPSSAFYLAEMSDIYDRVDGKADVPHRHDYYTLLFIESAAGNHYVDYNAYKFGSREVHFVSPGQVHQVALTKRPKGIVITFSRDFLMENNIPESFITNISLFRPFGESPPLKLDDDIFKKLKGIIDEMKACVPEELTFRIRALGALLQLFLIYCNNSSKFDHAQLDEENSSVCILRDFKSLVKEHYIKWHKVGQYADQIHITPKHLTHVVKSYTGMSAKQIIQNRIILEAKRLLLHTDITIKEIGYELGFEEPLHFSGFFKRQVGISPSNFRQNKL